MQRNEGRAASELGEAVAEDTLIFFYLVPYRQVFSEELGSGMLPVILPTLPLTKLPPHVPIRILHGAPWDGWSMARQPSSRQLSNVSSQPTPLLLHLDVHCWAWEIANIFLQAPCQLASFCQWKIVKNRRWEGGSSFLLLALMVWWSLATVTMSAGIRAQPWRRAGKPGSQSLAASDLSGSASAFRLLTSLLLFLQSCQKLLEPTPWIKFPQYQSHGVASFSWPRVPIWYTINTFKSPFKGFLHLAALIKMCLCFYDTVSRQHTCCSIV